MIIQTGLFQRDKRSSEKVMRREYSENISAEEIGTLELQWFRGKIVVVEDIETFNRVIPELQKSSVIGFDTETKPSFRKGKKNRVSLLQLANHDIACLFRLNRIGFPDRLVDILSDPGKIKAGVAIHDDLRFLKSVRGFDPEGFIDLQSMVKKFGIQSSGLKKLVAIILGFRISKRQQVTDWEADELSEAQIIYAATDAWVCYEIYRELT